MLCYFVTHILIDLKKTSQFPFHKMIYPAQLKRAIQKNLTCMWPKINASFTWKWLYFLTLVYLVSQTWVPPPPSCEMSFWVFFKSSLFYMCQTNPNLGSYSVKQSWRWAFIHRFRGSHPPVSRLSFTDFKTSALVLNCETHKNRQKSPKQSDLL